MLRCANARGSGGAVPVHQENPRYRTTLGTEVVAGLTTFLTLALQHGRKRRPGSATTRTPCLRRLALMAIWLGGTPHSLEERLCRSVPSGRLETPARAPASAKVADSETLAIYLLQAYILAVNPAIIADSGGTCHPCSFYKASDGDPPSSCFPDQFEPFYLPAIFTDAYVNQPMLKVASFDSAVPQLATVTLPWV